MKHQPIRYEVGQAGPSSFLIYQHNKPIASAPSHQEAVAHATSLVYAELRRRKEGVMAP